MTLTEFLTARVTEDEAAAHAARQDPARVLAECAAKRQILNRYLDACAADQSSGTFATVWGERREALATLAAVYADRADYDESWRS